MKRIIQVCLLVAVCFLLVSCKEKVGSTKQSKNGASSANISNSEDNRVKIQVNGSGIYGVYDMTGDFVDKVNDNPIDKDYEVESRELSQSPNFNTLAEIELESKYIGIWDKELNAIYNKLLNKLNSKEKEILIESQKGWLQYHTKETHFTYQFFYLRESGPILGSQGKVQMQQAIRKRLRERTLELMEYYEHLENDVDFVYKSTRN